MKRITIPFFAAMLFTACNNEKTTETRVATSASEPGETTEAWVPVDSATAEKAWMEYMTPGEPHKMLALSNGEWTGETKMWMSPEAPPMTNKGSASFKMIMGGRYQQGLHRGEFMGQAFEGISTTAYDNARKVFINTWIDNMGTGIMTMEGTWDEAAKTISYKGKMTNPANGKDCNVRENFKIVDDNTCYLEMFGPDMKTGKEFKTMEITFKRKK